MITLIRLLYLNGDEELINLRLTKKEPNPAELFVFINHPDEFIQYNIIDAKDLPRKKYTFGYIDLQMFFTLRQLCTKTADAWAMT